jgi:hypothetical protein
MNAELALAHLHGLVFVFVLLRSMAVDKIYWRKCTFA